MALCLAVVPTVALVVVTSLAARSVAAVLVLVVVRAVPSVGGMAVLVGVAAVVVAAGDVRGLDLCLRLLREGSRTVAGTVSCRLAVRWHILCRCFGPFRGLVVARSRVGRSRVGALCRRAVVVTAVRCGAVAV